jgi:uncharacterized protein YkwD
MMNRKHTIISALTCLLLFSSLLSCAPSPSRVGYGGLKKQQPKVTIAILEKQIHILINNERRNRGLSRLAWDDALNAIARKHSRDMAKRNYFAHLSPEGRDFIFRYKQEGYSCGIRVNLTVHLGAENIALNNLYDSITTVNGIVYHEWNSQEKIAETTVEGWMKSTGHRKNILTPHWLHEGIGVFIAPDDKVYITQNFC